MCEYDESSLGPAFCCALLQWKAQLPFNQFVTGAPFEWHTFAPPLKARDMKNGKRMSTNNGRYGITLLCS